VNTQQLCASADGPRSAVHTLRADRAGAAAAAAPGGRPPPAPSRWQRAVGDALRDGLDGAFGLMQILAHEQRVSAGLAASRPRPHRSRVVGDRSHFEVVADDDARRSTVQCAGDP